MVFSELGNSQGSFSYITQSSDFDIDDATLGKLLDEAHREHADYCDPEGVSVSQSSLSVVFDRTGKPVGENSSNAQIRTLLDEQRHCYRRVLRESFLTTNFRQREPKKNAEFYKKNYGVSKRIFVKFINKVLPRWRNYENSKVLPSIRSQDGSSSRTRTLFWNYSGRVQELQNEVHCMNDSGDFQDAESVSSGNSHVTSQPMSFPAHPTPEGMFEAFIRIAAPQRRAAMHLGYT